MNRYYVTFALLLSFASSLSSTAFSQTTGLALCANTTTGAIRSAARCSSRETQLTTKNFARVIGAVATPEATPVPGPTPTSIASAGVNLNSCYKTSGQVRGSPQQGELTVSVQCNRSNQLMLSHEFQTDDSTFAYPALQEQVIIYNGSVPNGVMLQTRGQPGKFYTLKVTAVCCDRQ